MEQSAIKFLGYNVREINFLKNDHYKGSKLSLKIKFSKNSTYLDNNRVRVNVHVSMFEDAIANNYPFSLSFIMSGLFQYTNINIEEDNIREALESKLLEIIYPYIRTTVSTIMTATNLPPIMLPTINLSQHIKKDVN